MSAAAEALPVNPASVEQIAFALADDVARADVECIGRHVAIDGHDWYDLHGIDHEDHDTVVFALRYMQARGEALPYRVICHPNYPFLRRFEARR